MIDVDVLRKSLVGRKQDVTLTVAELTELLDTLDMAYGDVDRLVNAERAAHLETSKNGLAAIVELLKDKRRLDFLDQCNARLNERSGTVYRWELILNHNVNRLMLGHMEVDLNDAAAKGLPSCRDALDREIERIEAARAARIAKEQQA